MIKEKDIGKITLYIILISAGIFFYVFGEYDDSPGGQLLGLVAVIVGIVGIIRTKKQSQKKQV